MIYPIKTKIFQRTICVVLICGLLLPCFGISSYAITDTTADFALAPPLATKPPCEIRYDERTGTCDVVTNNDAIELRDMAAAAGARQGAAPGRIFRSKWAFMEVGTLISEMLSLSRKQSLQNPKDILVPLIRKHISNRDGETEILLEGFDIDGIEEIWDGEVLAGLSLPVMRNGELAYKLIYNLQKGDTVIQTKGGEDVYVAIEIFAGAKAEELQSAIHPTSEYGSFNHIKYEIRWVNPKSNNYKDDRNAVREKFKGFLENSEKVETVLKGIGTDIKYEEINAVTIQYIRTSERIVFKINLSLTDEATRRRGPPGGSLKIQMAAKIVGNSTMTQIDAFRALRGTGLAPEFGELFDGVYYEEWMTGPTVCDVGMRNGLSSEELREITATWMKVMRVLSPGSNHSRFSIDMNPTNIMYKTANREPVFAVVDIFERKGKENNSALFLYHIIKYYVYGSNFNVKSRIPNDIQPILEGIYKGLDYNKAETAKFLEEALTHCTGKIYDPILCSAIKVFLRKLDPGKASLSKAELAVEPDIDMTERERVKAANFIDTVAFIQARSQDRPLVIALGTNWIKGYEKGSYPQYYALNPLIVSLRSYCESRGIPLIVDDDSKLPALINAERAREGYAGARVVVLAGKDDVALDEFTALRNDRKNTFVFGVDNQKLTPDSYIPLMEMLTIALKLSLGFDPARCNTLIAIVKDNTLRIFIFVPPSQPLNYEQLKGIYEVQKFA